MVFINSGDCIYAARLNIDYEILRFWRFMNMTSLKTKRRFNRIISGILSVAMTMTMVPEIWLPVYADSVRNDILNTDII